MLLTLTSPSGPVSFYHGASIVPLRCRADGHRPRSRRPKAQPALHHFTWASGRSADQALRLWESAAFVGRPLLSVHIDPKGFSGTLANREHRSANCCCLSMTVFRIRRSALANLFGISMTPCGPASTPSIFSRISIACRLRPSHRISRALREIRRPPACRAGTNNSHR
jgi:hypothetical protein